MCLARVRFAEEPEGAEPVATDVARVVVTERGITVTDLLGKISTIDAAIKSIDFMESTVAVEKKEGGPTDAVGE
jgi:predicted RNA-binding protein